MSLRPLLLEIDRAFDFFNAKHFDSKLPHPVVTFHPQPPNGRRLGHFWADRWTQDGQRRHEIVFYSDLCLEAGVEQVMQTLVHEMVHLWQHLFGKNKRGSHNAEWHRKARACGLETRGPKGYTLSTPDFDAQLRELAPKVDKVPWRPRQQPKPTKLRKYTCECGINLRVARKDFEAVCLLCLHDFVPAEEVAKYEQYDDRGRRINPWPQTKVEKCNRCQQRCEERVWPRSEDGFCPSCQALVDRGRKLEEVMEKAAAIEAGEGEVPF